MRKPHIILNDCSLSYIDYQGQRVVTFAMIDKVHGRAPGTAKRTFLTHNARFKEGDDYFRVTRDVIRTELPDGVFNPQAPEGILITESGYLILTKPFSDELAWQVQRELVKQYFRSVPEFPHLKHVELPNKTRLNEMPLSEAMAQLANAEHESFREHGQRGSASMALRRKEKKALIPLLAQVKAMSQPLLTNFEAACGKEEDA